MNHDLPELRRLFNTTVVVLAVVTSSVLGSSTGELTDCDRAEGKTNGFAVTLSVELEAGRGGGGRLSLAADCPTQVRKHCPCATGGI
jgi:hypothetical protein